MKLIVLFTLMTSSWSVLASAAELTEASRLVCTSSIYESANPFGEQFNQKKSNVEFSTKAIKLGSIKLTGNITLQRVGMVSYEYEIRLPSNAVLRLEVGDENDGVFGSQVSRNGMIWYYDGHSFEGIQRLASVSCSEVN